jgi:hypothetical protein
VGPDACAFGVGAHGVATSTLLIGVPLAEVGDDARMAIEQAAAYVVLEDARERAREEGRRALAAELVELAWSGDLGGAPYAARLRALGLDPDAELTVIASSNDAADTDYAARGCGLPCVTARHQDVTLLLLQADGETAVDDIAGLMRDGGAEPVLGVGGPGRGPRGLRQALAEAAAAHTVAGSRQGGERVVRHLGIASHAVLLDFVDRQVLLAFRDALLGPVERWDRDHGSELVATLRAFLARDGQLRATAAELHIHHNTLRYRLDRVARLTGRDIDATASRVDFALALAIPAAAPPDSGG